MWSNIVYNHREGMCHKSSHKWKLYPRSFSRWNGTRNEKLTFEFLWTVLESYLVVNNTQINNTHLSPIIDHSWRSALRVKKIKRYVLDTHKLNTVLKVNNTLYLYQLTSILECIHSVITKLQGDEYFFITLLRESILS